jgi:hypothetical protein
MICLNVVQAQLFVLLSPAKVGQVDTPFDFAQDEPKSQAETYYPHVSADALI